jgi:predicted Rossmann-fold nucleotide-binding protein
MKVAMIGSRRYEKPRKIREMILNLKNKFGDKLVIISGGAKDGADRYVKKYAIEHVVEYKEFNPAHTPRNLYSAMADDYYDKPYHVSQFHHRNMLIAADCEIMIAFIEGPVASSGTKSALDAASRMQKRTIIIS